jgi:hypothetical protein
MAEASSLCSFRSNVFMGIPSNSGISGKEGIYKIHVFSA